MGILKKFIDRIKRLTKRFIGVNQTIVNVNTSPITNLTFDSVRSEIALAMLKANTKNIRKSMH